MKVTGRYARYAIAAATILLLKLPLNAQTPVVPRLIESELEGYAGAPLWVSAQAAVDEKTVLNWELFDRGSFLHEVVESQREEREGKGQPKTSQHELEVRSMPQNNCTAQILMSDHLNDHSPAQSFRDLMRYSKHIFEGTIVAVESGFYRGVPASLLSVRIHSWLRVSAGYAEINHLYIYHSAAHFKIGPFEFCGASPGVEPKTGDKIVVFDAAGLATKHPMLLTPGDDKVFVETSSGELALPRQLRQDPLLSGAKSLRGLVELVRNNVDRANTDGSR